MISKHKPLAFEKEKDIIFDTFKNVLATIKLESLCVIR